MGGYQVCCSTVATCKSSLGGAHCNSGTSVSGKDEGEKITVCTNSTCTLKWHYMDILLSHMRLHVKSSSYHYPTLSDADSLLLLPYSQKGNLIFRVCGLGSVL